MNGLKVFSYAIHGRSMDCNKSIVVLTNGYIENPSVSSICYITARQAKDACIVKALCEDPYSVVPPKTVHCAGAMSAVPEWVEHYLPMHQQKDLLCNFVVLHQNELERGGILSTKLFGVLWFDGTHRVFSYSNNGEYSFRDIWFSYVSTAVQSKR